MEPGQWFDRKFDFLYQQNIFPSVLERLVGTSLRLDHKIKHADSGWLTINIGDQWSLLEHAGHLIDLEPLWDGRITDILNQELVMRPADLANTKTHSANHNLTEPDELLIEFKRSRDLLLDRLDMLSNDQIYLSALHPRLNKPMRIMDLCLFIAEHDDHHLAKMSTLISKLK